MSDTALRPGRTGWGAGTWRSLVDQFTYAWRGFWRTTVMAFVVLGFPLVFLLMLGVAGDGAEPGASSERFQAAAPSAIVFGAVMAAYVMLPFGIAQARERGVLKRLRGTPLPTWCYLAGRFGNAVAVAALGTLVMVATAVSAFGLQVPLRLVPAMVVTFVVGVGCFAALGFAVVALLRGSQAVMAFTMGSFLLTAFASGVFAPDLPLPRALDVGSWFLPLRHLATAFAATFDPGTSGAGFARHHLGVLLLWAVVAGLVAARRLRWEPAPSPRTSRGHRRGDAGSVMHPSAPAAATPARAGGDGGRPRTAALAWQQLRHANRALWREPAGVFFSVAFPVLFAIVVPYAFGQPVIDGVELASMVVPAMAVFGAVVVAYVNLPEAVALARDAGILKRLRGTPLPAGAYVAGRLASAAWVGAITVVAVFVAGRLVHGVTTPWGSIPALAVVFTVGILAMAALGLAIVALVRDAKTVPAVSLATFMPLAFISDMLAFGAQLPGTLETIAWAFPIKHFVHASDAAIAGGVAFDHLAALVGWGVVGAGIAVRWFRWEPA